MIITTITIVVLMTSFQEIRCNWAHNKWLSDFEIRHRGARSGCAIGRDKWQRCQASMLPHTRPLTVLLCAVL